MPASNKVVRQTVGLPADTARHVRTLAKQRRLSANRIIVELVEEGIEAQKRKQKAGSHGQCGPDRGIFSCPRAQR
jgi:predicted transcriptional regulator